MQSKKSAKKATKKKSAKPAKKAVKKVAKKATKKAAPKKSAKKAVKKAAPKKTAKKVVKKVAKSAKKVAKKVVKKAAPKKASKKSVPLKKVAKKVVKKVAPKKAAVKKVVSKKRAPKTFMKKVENTFNTIRESVGDFVKDTASTMMDKIAPAHDTPPMDISPSDNTGTSGSEHTGGSEDKTEGSDDEEEERRPFVKHKTSLKVGDKAPDFSASDQNGNTVTLSSLRGKTVILYFYPKDDTPGCTATACSLRDELDFLTDRNYTVVGVSADDERSHAKFARKYELPFPLLADTELKICYAYDVYAKKMFMGRIMDGIVRTTFIIDPNGYIQHVIDSVDTQNHAQQILGLEEEE